MVSNPTAWGEKQAGERSRQVNREEKGMEKGGRKGRTFFFFGCRKGKETANWQQATNNNTTNLARLHTAFCLLAWRQWEAMSRKGWSKPESANIKDLQGNVRLPMLLFQWLLLLLLFQLLLLLLLLLSADRFNLLLLLLPLLHFSVCYCCSSKASPRL